MTTNIQQVIELLESDEELTGNEIAARVGCSKGYVSQVKNKIAAKKAKEQAASEETENKEIDEEVNGRTFIKPIKIVPDQDVLTENDDDDDDDDTEYQCGGCGYKWQASKDDLPEMCPNCEEEF